MKCDDARRNLSMLMDGELADPAETLAHAGGCADCRAYPGRLRNADERLGAVASAMIPPADAGFARRVAARTKRSPLKRSIAVFAAMAALVLVAIGGIAINVNVRRPQPQEVYLLGSAELVGGERGRLRVHVRDGATQTPVAGARVLAIAKTTPPIEAAAASDDDGDATIEFDTPDNVTSISFEVRVDSPAGRDRLDPVFKVHRPRKLFISTDKPVYQPGQTIHARVLACAGNTMRPVAGEMVLVTIETPDGTKIYRRESATSEFGNVGVDFTLADEVLLGSYRLRAKLGGVESERTLEVGRYVLPKFRVAVASDQPWIKPGAAFHGRVEAGYFFGAPVAGTVRVTATVSGIPGTPIETAGELDGRGIYQFSGRIPDAARDDAQVEIEAEVADGSGHVERRSTRVSVSKQPLRVAFVPEGTLVPRIENRVFVVVSRPDGMPVAATIESDSASWETDDSGVALLPIEDPTLSFPIRIRARDGSAEIETLFDVRRFPSESRGFALRIDRPVVRAGQTLQVDALCAFPRGAIYLDLIRNGQVLLTRTLDVREGRGTLAVDLPAEIHGSLRIHAYRVLPDGRTERDARRVLVEPPQGLQIKAIPAKAEFRPGEEMPVTFEVTDGKGAPVRSALTIGVVDAAVFALHQARPGMERVLLAVEEDLIRSRGVPPDRFFETPGPLRPLLSEGRAASPDPMVASLNLAAKREFFARSARKFNRWLQDIAIGTGVIVLLIAIAAAIIWLPIRVWGKAGGVAGMTTIILIVALGVMTWFSIGMSVREKSTWGMAPTAQAIRHAPLPTPTMAPGHDPSTADGPRVRELFPETLFWTPELITDDQGRASLTLPAADSITSWTITTGAISRTGKMGGGTADLRVFQQFFIDLDLPVELTEGDRLALPVAIHNHSDARQSVSLDIETEDGIALEDQPLKVVEIGPKQVSSVSFRIRAAKFGRHAITVRARGTEEDAIRRTIDVRPDGREVPFAIGDRVQGRREFTVDVPDGAREGAGSLWLRIFPSGLSQVVSGLDRLVRMPTGCFEQSSSATYPNILTTAYLKETGQLTPETGMKLEQALAAGYQKLLTFEKPGEGGFAMYPGQPPQARLTAYGMLILSDMAKVYPVDPDVTRRSLQALNRMTWPEHEASYINWALAEAGLPVRAYDTAQRLASIEDPYEIALIANALILKKSHWAAAAVARLETLARQDSGTAAWETGRRTVVGSHGEVARIETTALAVLALQRAGKSGLADKGATALVRAKDPQGGWRSTQSTILALKALIETERSIPRISEPVSVLVAVNGQPVPAALPPITPDRAGLLQQVDLSRHLVRGGNRVEVTISGDGRHAVQVGGRYVLPWSDRSDPGHLNLAVDYDRPTLTRRDTLLATVRMSSAAGAVSTLIADLGIPPGFRVEEEDLRAMVTRKAIDRYALDGRRLTLYLDKVGTEAAPLVYRLRPGFVIEAKTPPSSAYEYYAPERNGQSLPQSIRVTD